MTIKYLINDSVVFYPDEHRLVNKQDIKVDLLLNIPASRCLALLIERKGCVITQKEFFEQVWESQGTYVTQNTFYQNISLLRKGLKAAGLVDDPIKTVLKRGITLADAITVVPYEAPAEEDVEQQDAPQAVLQCEVQPLRPRKLKMKWLYLLPLAIFAFFSMKYYQNRATTGDFFANYKAYGDINGCKLMIPKASKITDIYASFLQHTPPSCPESGVVYLTMDRSLPRISMIQCNKDIHSIEAECHSSTYLVD